MAEMDMARFRQRLKQTEADAQTQTIRFKREMMIGELAVPLWSPQETTQEAPNANMIRLAPPLRDGELCYVIFDEHYFRVGDEVVRFVCPRSPDPTGEEDRSQETCPGCGQQYALFTSSKASGNAADRARADSMRSKRRALWALLDAAAKTKKEGSLNVPNWQVMNIGAGLAGAGRMTTHQKLCGKFDRGGDLTHPRTGKWVRVVYTIGADPVTKQKSRMFGDWDFEPEAVWALPAGYERGLPDLPKLLDREALPTDDEILAYMGMAEHPQAAATVGGEPWDGQAEQDVPTAVVDDSWQDTAETATPGNEDAGWAPVAKPSAVEKKPAPKKPTARGRRVA